MAQTANVRKLDAAACINILNKRITLKPEHVGKTVKLKVQGNGTSIAKGEKYTVGGEERTNEFDRTIYNLKANSAMSMARPENKKLLAEAMQAESAGDTDKASELFNAYLNSVQVSFNVLNSGSRRFASGDDVKADIRMVTTKAGEQQIVVDSVSYVAPEILAETKFEVSDLLPAAE